MVWYGILPIQVTEKGFMLMSRERGSVVDDALES